LVAIAPGFNGHRHRAAGGITANARRRTGLRVADGERHLGAYACERAGGLDTDA
jgi:hypothetical protein